MRTVTPPPTKTHHPAGSDRPRVSDDLLAALPATLTPRDRWLTAMLHEHRVLTTTQITQLAFGTRRAATGRLALLYQRRVIDRFRPYRTLGSAPWHWVLDEAGARLLADQHTTTVRQLSWARRDALAVAASPRLTHTIGLHDVLCALAATAHTIPGARLDAWWSERRAAAVWGDWARPDAYAHYTEHHHGHDIGVDMFLEYDQGTEPLARLLAKLAGYTRLAEATGITTPVLFWLPGPGRETHLLSELARHRPEIPVATTHPALAHAHPDGPGGPIWAIRASHGARRRLVELPGATPQSRTAAPDTGTTSPGMLPPVPPTPPGPDAYTPRRWRHTLDWPGQR